MGTRNLTMVISEGQTRVAQYGQFDGYPSGQGATALEFLKTVDMEKFKEQLKKVRFVNDEDRKEMEVFLKKIGVKDGWLNTIQAEKYNKKYPYFSRDHAARILELIYTSKEKEILLSDETNFAGDSLFCEWCYVIDLDKRVLEVYKGFNKEPLTESERFFSIPKDKDGKYHQVKFVKSFSFDELPEEDEFVESFNDNEDIDDNE